MCGGVIVWLGVASGISNQELSFPFLILEMSSARTKIMYLNLTRLIEYKPNFF